MSTSKIVDILQTHLLPDNRFFFGTTLPQNELASRTLSNFKKLREYTLKIMTAKEKAALKQHIPQRTTLEWETRNKDFQENKKLVRSHLR